MVEARHGDALTEEEHRALFKVLWEEYEDDLTVVDEERRLLHVNRSTEPLADAILGRRLDELVRREDVEGMAAQIARAFRTGQAQWYEATALGNGQRYAVFAIPTTMRGRPVALLVSHDDTARLRAQQALLESESQYQTLTQHLPDFAVYLDRERRYLWVNRLAPGLREEDVLGRRVDDFTDPADLDAMRAGIEHCFATGEPHAYLSRTDLIDGKLRWLSNRLVPVPPANGVERVMLLTADITAQKVAEVALRESEERLALALEATGTGLWEWWPEQDRLRLDARWSPRRRGEPVEEYNLEAWLALVHPEDQGAVRAALTRLHSSESQTFELEYRAKTGPEAPYRWLSHRARAVEQNGPDALRVIGTQLDVTNRRSRDEENSNLQEQLERAQRLDSLGRLAGGVAHDFNNLLLVILSSAEMIEMDLAERKIDGVELSPIIHASERAAELTRQLLAFSRHQQLRRVSLDLAEALTENSKMLRRLLPETIEIVAEAQTSQAWAAVDPGKLEQVILNLSINARDAMPNGGQLSFKVIRRTVSEQELTPNDVATPGEFVSIVIQDTGEGMTAAQLQRAFEPFYTTKPLGQGTGLGLAMVDGIVKQHGGFIRCSSKRGKGTTFEVYWPVAADSGDRRSAPEALAPIVGAGKVLLAEDEPLLRGVTSHLLSSAGYDVTVVASGLEAIRALREAVEPFAALVLDAVMPGASGYEVLRFARTRHPEVPVVVTTGYAGDSLPAEVHQLPRVEVIDKPYRAGQLLEALARGIAAPSAPTARAQGSPPRTT